MWSPRTRGWSLADPGHGSMAVVVPAPAAMVSGVGECFVDETPEYGTWAEWLGASRRTFAAMFRAVIAQWRDHREVFQAFEAFEMFQV